MRRKRSRIMVIAWTPDRHKRELDYKADAHPVSLKIYEVHGEIEPTEFRTTDHDSFADKGLFE